MEDKRKKNCQQAILSDNAQCRAELRLTALKGFLRSPGCVLDAFTDLMQEGNQYDATDFRCVIWDAGMLLTRQWIAEFMDEYIDMSDPDAEFLPLRDGTPDAEDI